MKKILITGVNSYIGNSFEKWLKRFPDKYLVNKISLKNDKWQENSFSMYDVIFHVAGIAHVSSDPKMEDLYFKINRDLTIKVAKKSKADGVKQFIFMSSIIVYGDRSAEKGYINKDTIPNPENFYGKSKLQAEKGLKLLEDDNFKIVILRPPMIYGKNSKGNYSKLSKAVKLLPLFPDVHNKRSMIYIDNLSELIRLVIDNEDKGIFFPQNTEYIKTSNMVKIIAEVNGKKIRFTRLFNYFLIKILKPKLDLINKVFGDLYYDKQMSEYRDNYRVISDFRKTIELSEMGRKNEE
ncbi:UDP-glucose 4-epimerase [Melghiribacillus thermohalophilus]|uniref:UDP-glucose 4-epimerase n=1 Tax=Melghiribacillus thermohalophilus TaxID=1324956 RepID=A0A4R3NH03_9BACI|nr:NAD-dependent epimerase/dehydratase family protein [Melghiribacillus thermohalophilus]TCT26457.1 UDP-glucose 4-epimerase [Melghiribacillus thermohalophilus]